MQDKAGHSEKILHPSNAIQFALVCISSTVGLFSVYAIGASGRDASVGWLYHRVVCDIVG